MRAGGYDFLSGCAGGMEEQPLKDPAFALWVVRKYSKGPIGVKVIAELSPLSAGGSKLISTRFGPPKSLLGVLLIRFQLDMPSSTIQAGFERYDKTALARSFSPSESPIPETLCAVRARLDALKANCWPMAPIASVREID